MKKILIFSILFITYYYTFADFVIKNTNDLQC